MPGAEVLYDADCGLCVWLLALLLRWDRGGRLAPVALQSERAEGLLAGVPPGERMASWHLIYRGERVAGGAALAPVLRMLPGGTLPAALLERAPGLAEGGYGWVATHRAALSRLLPGRAKARARERVERLELAGFRREPS